MSTLLLGYARLISFIHHSGFHPSMWYCSSISFLHFYRMENWPTKERDREKKLSEKYNYIHHLFIVVVKFHEFSEPGCPSLQFSGEVWVLCPWFTPSLSLSFLYLCIVGIYCTTVVCCVSIVHEVRGFIAVTVHLLHVYLLFITVYIFISPSVLSWSLPSENSKCLLMLIIL